MKTFVYPICYFALSFCITSCSWFPKGIDNGRQVGREAGAKFRKAVLSPFTSDETARNDSVIR